MPSSPPSATSLPNSSACSLPQSPKGSSSPEIDSRRPSLKYIFAPLSQKAVKVTTPSTNKIILDYLLYLSIQSRLKQAHVELMELSTPLPDNDNSESIEERKRRWMDTARKAEQDKNAVEAIVAGILSSGSRAKAPSSWVDCAFEQRLHLCQLTNLVFGRFDATSTGQHVIAHNSTRRRRHEAQMMASVMEEESAAGDNGNNDANKENNQQCDQTRRRQQLFSRPIFPPFCRRHRFQNCHGCRSPYLKDKPNHALHMKQLPKIEQEDSASPRETPSNSRQSTSSPPPPAGLIEAIPTFLKTSADLLRRTLETNGEEGGAKPMIFAGQRVMGGGMPPRWYDLFLELLTQAAIESYLCDGQTGLEPIFEIFSYGDVEDEDEPDETEDDENENDDEEDEDREEDEWGVRAADHHLLFPKTRTMYLFKTQVREREKEFLVVEGDDLKQHFEKLAQRYPLEAFEKSMGEFIQMILSTTDVPALDKYDKGEEGASRGTSPELPSDAEGKASSSLPPVYKYPGDGSLLMPEIPDVDEEDQQQETPELSPAANESNVSYMTNQTRKRQASISQPIPEPKRAR